MADSLVLIGYKARMVAYDNHGSIKDLLAKAFSHFNLSSKHTISDFVLTTLFDSDCLEVTDDLLRRLPSKTKLRLVRVMDEDDDPEYDDDGYASNEHVKGGRERKKNFQQRMRPDDDNHDEPMPQRSKASPKGKNTLTNGRRSGNNISDQGWCVFVTNPLRSNPKTLTIQDLCPTDPLIKIHFEICHLLEIPLERISLLYQGHVLETHKPYLNKKWSNFSKYYIPGTVPSVDARMFFSLRDYGIEKDSIFQLILRLPGPSPSRLPNLFGRVH